MMPLKVRLWNTIDKVMITQPNSPRMVNGELVCDDDDVMLLFTGLQDKNGKDIYEGDIVRILYTDWPSQPAEKNGQYSMSLDEYKDSISNIGKIVYLEGRFCVQFNNDGYTMSIFCGTHGQIAVIGNIFQHPELLEDKS